MKNSALPSGILMLLFGALLAACAFWFLPICHAEAPMRCFWMTRAVGSTGVMIAVSGLVALAGSPALARGIQVGNALSGLLAAALASFVIGACPNPMMACHALTESVLVILGLLITVTALLDFWRLSRVK